MDENKTSRFSGYSSIPSKPILTMTYRLLLLFGYSLGMFFLMIFQIFPLRKTIEKVRSSFSAVWAARIAIQVFPTTARRTVGGSSEKMQPREDVRGKNENAEFCSRLPTKCGDGFRGFQSFCKVQTFFGLRPAIFRSLKTRDFRGICTPDCF